MHWPGLFGSTISHTSTTHSVAGVFCISLVLFIVSILDVFPGFRSEGAVARQRKSRDSNYVSFSNHSDYTESALVFFAETWSAGRDPYKDCRFKHTDNFGRKRQLFLPERVDFSLTPNFTSNPDKTINYVVFYVSPNQNFKRKVMKWAKSFNDNESSSIQVFPVFVYWPQIPEKSSRKLFGENNLILSSKEQPIVRSLSWAVDKLIPAVDLDYVMLIGANSKFLPDLNRITTELRPYSESLLYGGVYCYDYHDSPKSDPFMCNVDAFYCDSNLIFMNAQFATLVSDASWYLPPLADEDRYLGLVAENANVPFTALVLDQYWVGNTVSSRSSGSWGVKKP